MSARHPRGHWDKVMNRVKQEYGVGTFTTAEVAELMRGYVNPMEASRYADQRRTYSQRCLYESRMKDPVTVGLRLMAASLLYNRAHTGSIERVGKAAFRFANHEVKGETSG
jgi:hypothetical protein